MLASLAALLNQCRCTQDFCDDDMDPSFFSGQAANAPWKSIGSLERYRFVHRNKGQFHRGHNSYQRGHMPRDEFHLTDLGIKFIDAMLRKHPAWDNGAGESP